MEQMKQPEELGDRQPVRKKISMRIPETTKKRIVVIGGGFGGIEMIKEILPDDRFQVVLLDKHNYHTFQPLLYQVATAGLEPDSIAAPLRRIFKQKNDFYFRMAEVKRIIPEENCIDTNIGSLRYDYLVIASGSKTNYYGMEEVKQKAFPMKKISQALDLRSKILQNYEKALLADNDKDINCLMDIVIVGGGPTGVELAGAIAELRKYVLPKDLPELDFRKMDIYLLEAGGRLLNGMSDVAGRKALKYLENFGVIVKFHSVVKSYDGRTVVLKDGTTIETETLIWAAGVMGNTIPGLRAETMKGNRYVVDSYNRIIGYDNIFALGDVAGMITENQPKGHPMVAPVAVQQGKNLGKNIKKLEEGKNLKPFTYKDKGSMATIGRNRAVVDLSRFKFSGFLAWFVWMSVHLFTLIGFRNKVATFINWTWNYFTYDRATRLIIRPFRGCTPEERDE
ncbi:MAG TPA: NAD(P)/FAD-dependent oxidoreductase [Cytophagaceae bacterium]